MQTSAKKLSPINQDKISQQFITLLADLKKPTECQAFFESFLTETEQQVFAKRLGIIQLLNQGQSYDQIRKKLHVSSATISTVAKQMDQAGIELTINKLRLEAWAKAWTEKLTGWLN